MKKIIIASVLLVLGAAIVIYSQSAKKDHYTYIITETAAATSLDPLDADQTINLPVARMLYATPLEVDLKGDLQSSVLESFEYNDDSQVMTWKVKSGLKYADNTEITSEDVAFAVARMAYTRPTFPVIEDVKGVSEWSKAKDALKSLPEGIQISGQVVKIEFAKKQDHPLFRFCLEIFSIIPKKCVDVETNKISCKEIPSSGNYKLASKTDQEFNFEKRIAGSIFGVKAPEKIQFKYMTAQEALRTSSEFDSQTIMAGSELRYSVDEIKDLQSKIQISFAPASRIAGVAINPNVGVFKDKKCRQLFANAFREAFRKMVGDARESEASIFTDLLPGYLKNEELHSGSASITAEEIVSCKTKFQNEPIKWLKAKNNPSSLFVVTMEKVFSELGIEAVPPMIEETQKDEEELFLAGKLSVRGFQTGFWAFDPAGDIQMLMTPKMHKTLQFVSEDSKMQSLIRNLKDSGLQKDSFNKLNQHIYDEALFNVFTHLRRFYAAKDKSLIMEAPVSITSPAPWQVFKVD